MRDKRADMRLLEQAQQNIDTYDSTIGYDEDSRVYYYAEPADNVYGDPITAFTKYDSLHALLKKCISEGDFGEYDEENVKIAAILMIQSLTGYDHFETDDYKQMFRKDAEDIMEDKNLTIEWFKYNDTWAFENKDRRPYMEIDLKWFEYLQLFGEVFNESHDEGDW